MTLQTKMIAITIGALFLTLGAIIPSMRILWNNAEQNTVAIQQASISNLVKLSIDSLYPSMTQALQSFSRNRELKKALTSANKKQIEENVVTTFRLLSAGETIDQLEILSTDGQRLYSSADNTGQVKHAFVELVRKENKIITGLAQEANGKLFAFVGYPMTKRGKLIGIVLVSKKLSSTLKQVAKIDQSQITILSDSKNNLASSIADNITDFDLPAIGEADINIVDKDDTIQEINIVPLYDVQQKPFAHLVHITDITEKYNQKHNLFFINILLLTFLFLLIVVFLRWFIRKEFKGLDQAVAVQNKIADGDLMVTINNNRTDEIGKLLDSADRMGQKLRSTVSQVINSASQINMASDEFLNTTTITNKGMIKQQAAIEQLLTAVTEMSATVQEINQNNEFI